MARNDRWLEPRLGVRRAERKKTRFDSMKTNTLARSRAFLALVLALSVAVSDVALGQDPIELDEAVTVTIANQTAQVRPDGSFNIRNISVFVPGRLRNVQRNVQQLPLLHRVRATARRDGRLIRGQSGYIELKPGQTVLVDDLFEATVQQTPISVRASINRTVVNFGDTAQITVTAFYPDRSRRDVTARSEGTTYLSTNPGIATVDENGVVTGVNRGRYRSRATIFVINEGNYAAVSILSTPSNDSDQDGLPNDYEELFGLNRFRNDADEDLDNDGLTNIEEFRRGTIPNNPDTDADGIPDGQDGDPLHPEETPPTVQIVSPVDGSTVIEGTTVSFVVNAADDGLLTSVELSTDTGFLQTFDAQQQPSPFEAQVTIPNEIQAMILRAVAVDAADNSAETTVTINVVPDPLTAITGIVIGDGAPAPGVTATIFDEFSAQTNGDGVFTIPDVPTIRGDIVVRAIGEVNGRQLDGESMPVAPVAGKLVDVGEIILLRDPTLTSTGGSGNQGAELATQILIDTNRRLQGWSFGLCVDDQALNVVEFANGAGTLTVNGGGPPSFLVLERAQAPGNGIVMVVAVSIAQPNFLDPQTSFEALDITYGLDGANGTASRPCFCDDLIPEGGNRTVPTNVTAPNEKNLAVTLIPIQDCQEISIDN